MERKHKFKYDSNSYTNSAVKSIVILISIFFTVPLFSKTIISSYQQTEENHSDTNLLTKKELLEREKKLVKQLGENPQNLDTNFQLVSTYVALFQRSKNQKHFLKQAGVLAKQCIEMAPDDSKGYVALASVLSVMGINEKAIALLSQVKKIEKMNSFELNILLLNLKQKEGLLSSTEFINKLNYLYQKTLSVHQHDKIASIAEGFLSASDNSNVFNKLESKKNPRYNLILAEYYLNNGKKDKAIALLKDWKAQSKKPNVKFGLLKLRTFEFLTTQEKKKAIKSLLPLAENVSKEKNDSLSPSSKHQLTTLAINLAILMDKMGSKSTDKKVLELFRNASKISGNPIEVGKAFLTSPISKNTKYGKQFFEWLIQENPGKASLHALVGDYQLKHNILKDFPIDSYTNAIVLEPNQSRHYSSLGLAYYEFKDYQKALALFDKATKINPSDALAIYNKACMLALIGEKQLALETLAVAIQLDPELSKSAPNDPDLANLKETHRFQSIISNTH